MGLVGIGRTAGIHSACADGRHRAQEAPISTLIGVHAEVDSFWSAAADVQYPVVLRQRGMVVISAIHHA
jgi:hypothetical protein